MSSGLRWTGLPLTHQGIEIEENVAFPWRARLCLCTTLNFNSIAEKKQWSICFALSIFCDDTWLAGGRLG